MLVARHRLACAVLSVLELCFESGSHRDMPKWKPTLLTAILILNLEIVSAFALPRQSDSISPAQPVTTISFVLFHNRVYLPVEVNGHETFEVVLDTSGVEVYRGEADLE